MKVNNFNVYNKSFSGSNMDKKEPPLTVEQMNNVVMPKCREILIENGERRIPEIGPFSKFSLQFNVPGAPQYEGTLIVDFDTQDVKKRILQVGVHHQNSDRLFSHMLINGTKKELLDYLKNDDNQKDIIDSVQALSKEADKYYSKL